MVSVSASSVTDPVIPQYRWGTILAIWAAAALPMAVLGWVVAPALSRHSASPVLARLGVLTVGLIWQFVLVLLLLGQETPSFYWRGLAVGLRLAAAPVGTTRPA